MKRLKREFDDKAIAAHLYVTDRCNLDCHYCSEYDNSVPHPKLEDLKKWIRKIKELGCIRIGLQGGEPLDHPDIVEIVRFCKSLGLKTTMSTNGFLLTPELIRGFEDAGLDGLQLSVDRMAPIPSTRKSLKTIMPKLEYLDNSSLKYNITGVVFKQTITEAYDVVNYGLSRGISTHARLIHTDPSGTFKVDPGDKEELERFIDYQLELKKKGQRIHTSWRILRYQKALLNQEQVDWTCLAGYKYFFVSASGKFWLCSMNRRPNLDIMEVTREVLRSYFHKKSCQKGCGVYCVISESLASSHRLGYVVNEAVGKVQIKAARLRAKLAV
ncbi:MAG: radical SAM protein [bacterium]